MYARYWGLEESPFSGSGARFYFESPSHEEALSRMLYVVEERRPCGLLYGPAGSGKTLLLQLLTQQIRRMQREVIVLDLTDRGEEELLWDLHAELGLAPLQHTTIPVLWRQISDLLLSQPAAGYPMVILLDQLELARPGCFKVLQRLFPLLQRQRWITLLLAARAEHLSEVPLVLRDLTDLQIPLPWLTRAETALYIRHLLQAGGTSSPIFEERAIQRLFEMSHGSPRKLNQLCDLSLLAAMAHEEPHVSEQVVLAAAGESLDHGVTHRRSFAMAGHDAG